MRWLLATLLLTWACSPGEGEPTRSSDESPDSPTTGLPASPESSEGLMPAPDASAGGGDPSRGTTCFAESSEPAFFSCDAAMEVRCPGLRSCCVGDSTCCSVVSTGPLPSGTVELDGCADGDAVACLTAKGWAAEAFGDPRPAVRDGALMPMGDDSYDSGVVIGGAVDLGAHSVVLTATFGAPSSCEGACLEAVGVGLTAAAELHQYSYARALIGLLYSGARGEVSLVRGDTVVASWPMTEESATYALHVRVDSIEVERDGTILVVTEPLHADHGSLVVWGRNQNRDADAPIGARITDLRIQTELCDIPTLWADRAETLVRDPLGAPFLPVTSSAPSVASDPSTGRTLVAFENDGNILIAERSAEGELILTGPAHESAINRPAGASLRDPELVYDPAHGGFLAFYTIDRGETASIGVATGGADGITYTMPGPIIEPKDELLRIEQPTAHRHYSAQWVVIARGTDASGVARLVAFVSEDGGTWAQVEGSHLAALTRRGDVSADGFDADEIAHPSILVHNGAWQLYYAGRRGTRWGIGLIVSDELIHWRDVGQVLAGDGNGFDRIGVSAPDAAFANDEVTLVFEGFDGVRTRLGFASRSATALGTR